MDIPDSIQQYYHDKARDLPGPRFDDVHTLIGELDRAVVDQLHHGGSQEAVDEAFDKVINHPASVWTREVLSYRIRQLYYH